MVPLCILCMISELRQPLDQIEKVALTGDRNDSIQLYDGALQYFPNNTSILLSKATFLISCGKHTGSDRYL